MANQLPHLSIDLWLDKLDLNVYKPIFKKYNGVEDILWMTERDLKTLGVKNGSHRARLGSSLAILKEKYDRASRENRNMLSPNGQSPHSEKAKSITSVSPIRQIHLEDTQSGVRSWPSTRPSTSHSTKHSSPRSSIENFVGTEATAEELKRALEKELSLDSSDLRSYAWYHGTILRQRAEELVVQDGDFLVRDCISQPGDYVITCKWKNVPLHFIIKKVILNPDTVYERFQYCFEKESFDSISDFITYYVGSKCPLSEASGVIISHPVNRVMPLSYYASRYGIQCQIHYVAKALEKIPSSPDHQNNNSIPEIPLVEISPARLSRPNYLQQPTEDKLAVSNNQSSDTNKIKHALHQNSNLVRMGSDPMLSPNTERRSLERRPNSGLFSSETLAAVVMTAEDKPPPKPSRVPSKKCVQRPLVVKKERKSSEVDDNDSCSPNFIPVPSISPAHADFQRQISETRFSFLDRPSISSESSTPDVESTLKYFTMPKISDISAFKPQQFRTSLLSSENPPLEGVVLSRLRQILLCSAPKTIACHLTRMDLEIAKHFEDVDLGLGVSSGLELIFLPKGEQMQKDLIERTECMKLFVAVLILTSPDEDERMKVLNRWIEVAIETKTTLGNYYGFTSIMLGLTLPEILGLQSTWLALRHSHTEIAFMFETKLRPTLKALQNGSGLEAPNTCLPYILSLILILQKHISVMSPMEKDVDSVCNNDVNFTLPGNNSAGDYGLQLLADHLENGRNILQQVPVFRKNGEMSLRSIKFQDVILDVFNTEFHLRLLWGCRGSIVGSEQRHAIFQKVVNSLYNRCIAAEN